jgi:hypothetical protein
VLLIAEAVANGICVLASLLSCLATLLILLDTLICMIATPSRAKVFLLIVLLMPYCINQWSLPLIQATLYLGAYAIHQ